ncbi:MAG: GAF domain-containing protein, partial [Betaproteobacteria bacterium]|nr:GAF domain-containing protein [Betaproteobacteria bacterium]
MQTAVHPPAAPDAARGASAPVFADALFDALGAIALVIDADGRIVRMNRAAEEFTGHSSAQACGEPFYWERFVPPAERERVRAWFGMMHSRSIPPLASNHWLGAQGELRLLRWSNTILDDEQGRPAYLIAIGTDVTEQERLTRVNARLASYRAFLAQVSQAMAQAASETELLLAVCELAVRHAGVRLAWVGSPDETSTMRIIGSAGPAVPYLDGLFISVDERLVEGQGSTGRCWREQRAYFNLSFAAHAMLHPWRQRAEAHNLQASAVLPIRRGQSMLAVLTLYSDEPEFFDAPLQELLLELVNDIERGLDHLQLRQLNKALVDHMDAGVAVVREQAACSR